MKALINVMKKTCENTKKIAKAAVGSSRVRDAAMGTIGAIAMTGLNVAMAKYTGKKAATSKTPGKAMAWTAAGVASILATSAAAGKCIGAVIPALMYKTDEEYEAYMRFMSDDPMYHGEDDDDDDEEFDSDVREVETNLHRFEDMCKHMHTAPSQGSTVSARNEIHDSMTHDMVD